MRRFLWLPLALALLLAGCGAAEPVAARRTVLAMDTVMLFTVYGAGGEAARKKTSPSRTRTAPSPP